MPGDVVRFTGRNISLPTGTIGLVVSRFGKYDDVFLIRFHLPGWWHMTTQVADDVLEKLEGRERALALADIAFNTIEGGTIQ